MVVARFKVSRVQLMRHDSAAIFVSHSLGPAGMVEVTVSQQKVFEFHIWVQAFGNIFSQSPLFSPASGINKGCPVTETDKVDSRIRRIGQPAPPTCQRLFLIFMLTPTPLCVLSKYTIMGRTCRDRENPS